jgi:alpha-1,3-rhamnosyl/mannosyltransferase
MKLAIDCRYILDPNNGQFGGISEYTDGLARALLELETDHEFVLFFSDKYSGDLAISKSGVKIVRVSVKRGNFFFNHFIFPWIVRSHRPDIFFSPHGQLPLGWWGRAVVTIHDLAIFDHPEWFPGGFVKWFSTKIVVPISLRRAEKIVVVSETTKNDLKRIFGVCDKKIFVVYPGCPLRCVRLQTLTPPPSPGYGGHGLPPLPRAALGQRGRYFLCLGTIEPRKNFILAARAIKILREKFPDVKLLIAGGRGWKFSETVREFDPGFVEELGFVSLEQKAELLAGAQALVFPSLYEGFGLPPLEAMKLGVPVITTRSGALPEVCGEAASYVSINDPAELAQVMEKMFDEKLRTEYIEKGLKQAEKFSWKKSAEEILKNVSL